MKKIMWVLVLVILALAAVVAGVLAHPAFGVYRHVSKEKIERSPNYYDGMFQNQEPEQNARTIAAKHGIRLLDARIGEKVDF